MPSLWQKNQIGSSRYIDPSVFKDLGSNVNPILTQIAKTKKAVFVEGHDFQIIGQFARRSGFDDVNNRSSFGVIPMKGFNPQRAKNLKEGIELTLGGQIKSLVILDRDYRSKEEIEHVKREAAKFCDEVIVHSRKEIENFLLEPDAIFIAATKRVEDRKARGATSTGQIPDIYGLLSDFAAEQKAYVQSRIISLKRKFGRPSRCLDQSIA